MAKNVKKSADGKQRVELRIDLELYRLIESTAKDADISINQLVQGVLWWAMPRANAGRYTTEGGRDAGPYVFFAPTDEEMSERPDQEFDPQQDIIFELDFSDRRAVVDRRKGGNDGKE